VAREKVSTGSTRYKERRMAADLNNFANIAMSTRRREDRTGLSVLTCLSFATCSKQQSVPWSSIISAGFLGTKFLRVTVAESLKISKNFRCSGLSRKTLKSISAAEVT